MPLKGANLVALYPDYSMREVGDNDILYGAVWRDAHGRYHSLDAGEWNVDSPNRESVLRIMRELGYSRSPEGYECHLQFYKEPGLCFELHNSLFEKDLPMWRYYQNPWLRARALSEGSDPSLCHAFLFPPEDEYVYCLAHTFKHSLLGGYGLRALADIIVMNRAFGNVLDREYIREQLLELGILDFAESLERLGRAVYDGSPLTEDQEVAVLRMMECDTYGSKTEGLRIRMHRAAEEGRHPRLVELRRFFSFDTVRDDERFAAFERHRWLRPLFPLARVFDFARRALSDPRGQLSKIAALLGGARGR
ncbi:nucleotidyltransferase family protein [Collinsella tanakaei]|nr:nucleotidyltransferase family protein [Collinsella tanakaei]